MNKTQQVTDTLGSRIFMSSELFDKLNHLRMMKPKLFIIRRNLDTSFPLINCLLSL